MKRLLLVLSISLVSQWASAHARFEAPTPRSTDSGNESAPCGPYAHTSATAYQTGSTITVTWEETIHHSGSFAIYFSQANDTGLSMGTDPAPAPTPLYSAPNSFSDSTNLPHQYSAKITLPKTPCTGCSLQLVQTATDNGVDKPFYYFSCSDITLTTTAPVATPTPAPTVTPTGAPSSAAACLTPTFKNVNANIIQPMCISCHQGAGAPDGKSFTTYAGVLGVVNTANPLQSLIYQLTLDGAMPEPATPAAGQKPVPAMPLTQQQQSLLLQWIQAGAPNN